jgi:tight adherence protein C
MQATMSYLGWLSKLAELGTEPLLVVSTFGFLFLVVLTVIEAAQSRATIRKRAIAFNPAFAGASGKATGSERRSSDQRGRHSIEEASELLFAVERGLGAGQEERISKIRGELIRAGFFRKDAVLFYYVARAALGCLFAYLGPVIARALMPSPSAWVVGGAVLAGASVGLMAPLFYLRRRHRSLHQQCVLGFPTFLDLLLVCCEAGLAPRAGIERVSREITKTHPFLGANLFLMTLELRAGRALVDAIDALGRRIYVDEVRSLGSLLQQTEALGSNLTQALRVYSDEMQGRRLLRAEERAHGLPVKLVLPLAFFVFPAMLIVVLMPVFIRIHKAFL